MESGYSFWKQIYTKIIVTKSDKKNRVRKIQEYCCSALSTKVVGEQKRSISRLVALRDTDIVYPLIFNLPKDVKVLL